MERRQCPLTASWPITDKKAHRVGDIFTIVDPGKQRRDAPEQHHDFQENLRQRGDCELVLYPAFDRQRFAGRSKGNLPAMSYNSDTEFNGGGAINNAETITAQMAVRVVDVLPNGNMVVEGTLRTSFSGEKQDAVLRGTVRPDDIAANNTLFSYNIAGATIQFISKGTITDNQRKGWFTTIWDKVNPF